MTDQEPQVTSLTGGSGRQNQSHAPRTIALGGLIDGLRRCGPALEAHDNGSILSAAFIRSRRPNTTGHPNPRQPSAGAAGCEPRLWQIRSKEANRT